MRLDSRDQQILSKHSTNLADTHDPLQYNPSPSFPSLLPSPPTSIKPLGNAGVFPSRPKSEQIKKKEVCSEPCCDVRLQPIAAHDKLKLTME